MYTAKPPLAKHNAAAARQHLALVVCLIAHYKCIEIMATMHLLREIHNICTWEHDQGEKWDVKQFAKLHFDLRGEERL